jgi:hypothetical protein
MKRAVLICFTPSGQGGGSNLFFSDQPKHFGMPRHRAAIRVLNCLMQEVLYSVF